MFVVAGNGLASRAVMLDEIDGRGRSDSNATPSVASATARDAGSGSPRED